MKAASCSSCAFCLVYLVQNRFRQSITSANNLKPHAVLPEPRSLQAEESAKQPENTLHLGSRSEPIVGGEGKDRKATDTHIRSMLHDAPQRGRSGSMAGKARQT